MIWRKVGDENRHDLKNVNWMMQKERTGHEKIAQMLDGDVRWGTTRPSRGSGCKVSQKAEKPF